MKTVNYTKESNRVDTSKDGVIVRKHISGLAGGRALDMDGYTAKVVPCGLPIISDGEGNYKPLVPTATGFTLPEGYTYAGLCGSTTLAGKPVAVVVAGVINEVAMVNYLKDIYGLASSVTLNLTAIKTALPHLIFEKDEAGDIPTV